MDLNLNGKTAVVTGGSKGIGAAIALSLAAEGCKVHIVSRTEAALAKHAAYVSAETGTDVTFSSHDLSDSRAIPDLISVAGLPDILINNAGAIPAGDILSVEEGRWREAWELKVFGYINMCRAFYEGMKKRGSGVIINVTGLAADRFDAGYIAGTTGNAGLNAFSKALGGRSLIDGVRVLAVSPGAVATERIETLMRTRAEKDFGDPEKWQSYLSNLPAGRAAKTEEVAEVVTFLASDRASFVSGSVVTVDGGHGGNMGSFA
jgi:NAD(P)-dependent dehydrogenase (short-subunit alcohol dehydrogenase family)